MQSISNLGCAVCQTVRSRRPAVLPRVVRALRPCLLFLPGDVIVDDESYLHEWTLQGNYRWRHSTNRTVSLESTHILLLHEFERVALKRVALQKLNSSDLGFTARIPKGNEGRR